MNLATWIKPKYLDVDQSESRVCEFTKRRFAEIDDSTLSYQAKSRASVRNGDDDGSVLMVDLNSCAEWKKPAGCRELIWIEGLAVGHRAPA